MPIQFMIRKYRNYVPFKDAILKMISMGGNNLVLSTGYIVDLIDKRDRFEKKKLMKEFTKVIIDAIIMEHMNITIVGENDYKDINAFIRFSKLLERYVRYIAKVKSINLPNFKVTYKSVIFSNWHGKVAIRYRNDNCKLEILSAINGSSNFTLPALMPSRKRWNRETDMYIVNGDLIKGCTLIESKFSIQKCKDEFLMFYEELKSVVQDMNGLGIKLHLPVYDDYKDKSKFWLDFDLFFHSAKQQYGEIISSKWVDNKYPKLNKLNEAFEIIHEIGSVRRISIKLVSEINNTESEINSLIKSIVELKNEYGDRILINQLLTSLNDYNKYFSNKVEVSYEDLLAVSEGIKTIIKREYAFDIVCIEQEKKLLKSLESLRTKINESVKRLLSSNTIIDLTLKDTYTESVLMGIYEEVEDIIQNFTLHQYP